MRFTLVLLIVLITYCSMGVATVWSQSSSAVPQEGTTAGAGMKASAAAAPIAYFPF
ncbi:MAG: hypothetical protein H8K03_21550 [Nitrospira sp.]